MSRCALRTSCVIVFWLDPHEVCQLCFGICAHCHENRVHQEVNQRRPSEQIGVCWTFLQTSVQRRKSPVILQSTEANKVLRRAVPAGMVECLQSGSLAPIEMKLDAAICTDSMLTLFVQASRIFVDVNKFHLLGHVYLVQSFLENGAYFHFPSLQNKIETAEVTQSRV